MKYMERKYECGKVVEVTRFVVGENTKERPRWRKAKTAADKREENHRHCARQLARILNCNADKSGFFVTLDYTPAAHEKLFAGMDEDQILRESKRQGSLFARRLRNRAGKNVKVVWASSDREVQEDGSLEPCRIHNHVVVMGATEEQIRAAWKLGYCVDVRSLYDQADYTPLAVYIVRQVRSLENYNKFDATRNMEKPKISERVVKGDPGQEIRVQPGAEVLDRMGHREGSVVQYVRYLKRPKKEKVGGKKQTARENQICGGADGSGRTDAEGGSGYDFSKIAWT